jgi:Putative MetA-pathway of phenol degradation
VHAISGHRRCDVGVKIVTVALVVLFGLAGKAHAAHPLITDDAGTQGKGKGQFEFVGEYDHDKKDGVTTDSIVAPMIPVLSYGMTDAIDIVLGISYERVRTSDAKNTATSDGISDASVELKWRIYENDGLSFALKPGITLPTGNHEKGLGAGRATSHFFFITTREVKPWAFHLNLGYIRNENKVDERINIWHASLAGVVDVLKNLKAVTNIGIERDRDTASNADPGFILGGLIYSISENLDFDIGIKKGFNNHGTDYSIPAGITWRY